LPLTENIGHRALIYVEEYSLSSNVRAGDGSIIDNEIMNYFVTDDAIYFLCSDNSKPNCSGMTFAYKLTNNINEMTINRITSNKESVDLKSYNVLFKKES